jgi:hypothetical protein
MPVARAVKHTVGTHKRSNVGVTSAALEWWQVVLDKILLRDLRVELITQIPVPTFDIIACESCKRLD